MVLPLDAHGRLVGEIALATRGVLDSALDAHLLTAARNEAHGAVEELYGSVMDQTRGTGTPTDDEVAETARRALRRTLGRVLGFKPVTTATVLRVRP